MHESLHTWPRVAQVAIWGRRRSDLYRLVGRLSEEEIEVSFHVREDRHVADVELHGTDLLLLDLGGDLVGEVEICRTIKERSPHTYLVIAPFSNEEVDVVVLLEAGADDVVHLERQEEALARVRAGLRRALIDERKTWQSAARTLPQLEFAGLRIDPEGREIWKEGDPVRLTGKEFELLYFLARHRGRTFSRTDLLEHVWEEYEGYERTVDTHVRRLRSKLDDDPDEPRFIATVWGVGYKFIARSNGS